MGFVEAHHVDEEGAGNQLMDMQRTTYCEAAMALLALTNHEEWARIVDCAIGLADVENRECWSLDRLLDYIDTHGGGGGGASDYIKVSDVKANNTAGGAFNNGAWRTRDINTEDSDTGGHCAIAANQITLQAGTYIACISAPGYVVNSHKARLQNITDGATTLLGTSEETATTNVGQTRSLVTGRFTIAAAKTFEVQHRCETTRAGDGFGDECNFGVDEVYTVAEFWKVA